MDNDPFQKYNTMKDNKIKYNKKEKDMLAIGCHLSTSKGYETMGHNALEIGANTFQFFTRNPRGSKAKDIDPSY